MSASRPWSRPQQVACLLSASLMIGAVVAALHCRADGGAAAHQHGPAPPAKWGPAMLTFSVRGQVWGTTGVGDHLVLLLSHQKLDCKVGRMQWSPDGRRLVYEYSADIPTDRGLWAATYSPERGCFGPPECLCPSVRHFSLSPDGLLVAYCRPGSESDEYPSRYRLVVTRLGARGRERVSTDITPLLRGFVTPVFGLQDMEVAWAPSGRAFATSAFRIPLVDLDAHTSRGLDSGAVPVGPLRWSPDGERLAFSWTPPIRRAPDGEYVYPMPEREISIIKPDGTGLTNLTNDPRADERPMWSPDGRLIAFLRGERVKPKRPETRSPRPGGAPVAGSVAPPSYDWAIWAMSADGTDQRQLTPEGVTNEEVAWSPDGRWIAYKTNEARPGKTRLWVVGLDGSAPQEVAADLRGIGGIAWRPAMTPSPKKLE